MSGLLDFLDQVAPSLKEKVVLYTDPLPLFEAVGIEREIEKALQQKVWLDCGGYVVIDQTEALVSIDVNTGKYIGSKNLAHTVLKNQPGGCRGNRPAAALAQHRRHCHY